MPAPHNSHRSSRHPSPERKQVRDEVQDIAKLSSELLKKTVVSGLGVIKDVTDGLPKEAGQILSKGKEEFLKHALSKEVLQLLLTSAIDRAFARLQEHKLEISIRVRKADSEPKPTKSNN
jgi:hypothetical protein